MCVALDMLHVKHMCHVILPSMTSSGLPYFFTLSHIRQDFLEKSVIEHNVCLDFLFKVL